VVVRDEKGENLSI